MKSRMAALAATAAVLAFAGAAQASVSVTVLGTSNPFDAGRASPSDGGAGAVLATASLVDGQYLTFSVTGGTNNINAAPTTGPDGGGTFGMTNRNGISGGT